MSEWPEESRDQQVAEAAEKLMTAVVLAFASRDDDELVPMRAFFSEVAEACSVRSWDAEAVPEWAPVGWLRERCRLALAGLATGERP